jgi:diguanylate cyclase (GGDEF)-like protein
VKKYIQRKTVTEQNRTLEQLSFIDPMTGIYNRRRYEQRIKEPIKTPAAICLFDMDGLKLINDALGHIKGDSAIKLTVEAIKKIFINDFHTRIGGDEFVVLVEDTSEEEVLDKIEAFQAHMQMIDKLEIKIDVSVGYAMINEDADIMSSYKFAENIMYHIKLGARSSRKKRSMEALMTALHENTDESLMHCQRVGYISQLISKKMGFNRKSEQESMKIIGQLHDIGMLSIPQEILDKKGPLTEEERMTLELHSEESFKIVSGLIDDKEVENSILYHHERWDGSGYPYKLCGNDIPIFARIFAVADAYDAMTSERGFQKIKTHEEACKEIRECSGSQFDPEVVEAFFKIPYTDLE